jgi:hypothetical protein
MDRDLLSIWHTGLMDWLTDIETFFIHYDLLNWSTFVGQHDGWKEHFN